jgi:hypothetical protein
LAFTRLSSGRGLADAACAGAVIPEMPKAMQVPQRPAGRQTATGALPPGRRRLPRAGRLSPTPRTARASAIRPPLRPVALLRVLPIRHRAPTNASRDPSPVGSDGGSSGDSGAVGGSGGCGRRGWRRRLENVIM